jgi:hypothetical protein
MKDEGVYSVQYLANELGVIIFAKEKTENRLK